AVASVTRPPSCGLDHKMRCNLVARSGFAIAAGRGTIAAADGRADMDGVRIVGAVEGQPVREATLVSPTGARVAIMSWGVTLRDWQVPVGDTLRPVVLGFPDFAPYPRHGAH